MDRYPSTTRVDRWVVAPLLGVVALCVYWVTLSGGAYPGESARWIAERMGLLPELSPERPIYKGAAWLFQLFSSNAVSALNLMSALTAALAVGLLYRLASGWFFMCIDAHELNLARARLAARLGGVVSALALAFSIPFWIGATRAHPVVLDILLLLLAADWLRRYAEGGRVAWLGAFALLCGAGCVEFATFIIFLPVLGAGALFVLWRREELVSSRLGLLVLCGLAGLLLYFPVAWRFCGTPGYELREFRSFGQVLWYGWREQYGLITHSLPPRGWVFVVMMSIVPWLAMLGVARRALNEERDWSYYFLHFVMTALSVAVLVNVSVAPWPMLGESRFLVTPYLLTAIVSGYLAVYWFLVPFTWISEFSESRIALALRKGLGWALVLPWVALVIVMAFFNLKAADGRPAVVVDRLARAVLQAVPDADWLVTDGSLDGHLLIQAAAQNRRVHLLDFYRGNNPVYMRYIVGDIPQLRLRNLAEVGTLPFLIEWLKVDPALAPRLALMIMPDVWIGAGYLPMPDRFWIRGVKPGQPAPPAAWRQSQADFWDQMAGLLKPLTPRGDRLGFLAGHWLRHMSFIANNSGVFFEDAGAKEDADKNYVRARELDPSNVSALLNQSGMIREGYDSGRNEAIRRDFEALDKQVKSMGAVWGLSSRYGYIRSPECWANLGWLWTLSGQRGIGLAQLESRLGTELAQTNAPLKQWLANIYLRNDAAEKSGKLYAEILSADKKNVQAMLGLAHVAARQGDFAAAIERLREARAAGVPEVIIKLELAMIRLGQDRLEDAVKLLQAALSDKPDFFPAWMALSQVALEQNDTALLQTCLDQMEKNSQGRLMALELKAAMAMRAGNKDEARRYLEESLSQQPRSLALMEKILQIDLMDERLDWAEPDAKRILLLDVDNALGNFAMGMVHAADNRLDMAEDSYRASLKARRSAETLNNLAEVLADREDWVQAEKTVREALAMRANLYQGWDSLGLILMKTGRLEEAAKAFTQALSLSQDDAEVYLHFAELELQLGHPDVVRGLLPALSGKRRDLSAKLQERLDQVIRQIPGATAP